jgi:hypothetical protein
MEEDHAMTTCCSNAATSRPTVRNGQRQGEIRVDCDATVLASFLINTWEGAVLRAKVEKNDTPLEEFEEIVFEKLLTSSPNPRRNEA